MSATPPPTTTTTTVATRLHKLPGDSIHAFVEYVRPNTTTTTMDGDGSSTTTIEALAVLIDPKECSRIVKTLSQCLPLPRQFQHLKRVKRFDPPHNNTLLLLDPEHSPPTKRSKAEKERSDRKSSPQLQLLLGVAPLSTLLESFHVGSSGDESDPTVPPTDAESMMSSSIKHLRAILYDGDAWIEDDDVSSTTTTTTNAAAAAAATDEEQQQQCWTQSLRCHPVSVPRRPPQSQEEARQSNQLWPTHFFPLQSVEHKQQRGTLSPQELQVMVERVQGLDKEQGEAWVLDPSSNLIVAKSGEEEALQEEDNKQGGIQGGISMIRTKNPLATPILFAIQGVSRLERQQQQQQQQGGNSSSQQHHYLCSGYDLYCNYEPCVFESMAMVHSRLGRVIWSNVVPCPTGSVWRHGLSRHTIHCLPGTNHHFRALEYKRITMD
jgi:hypothetical protein